MAQISICISAEESSVDGLTVLDRVICDHFGVERPQRGGQVCILVSAAHRHRMRKLGSLATAMWTEIDAILDELLAPREARVRAKEKIEKYIIQIHEACRRINNILLMDSSAVNNEIIQVFMTLSSLMLYDSQTSVSRDLELILLVSDVNKFDSTALGTTFPSYILAFIPDELISKYASSICSSQSNRFLKGTPDSQPLVWEARELLDWAEFMARLYVLELKENVEIIMNGGSCGIMIYSLDVILPILRPNLDHNLPRILSREAKAVSMRIRQLSLNLSSFAEACQSLWDNLEQRTKLQMKLSLESDSKNPDLTKVNSSQSPGSEKVDEDIVQLNKAIKQDIEKAGQFLQGIDMSHIEMRLAEVCGVECRKESPKESPKEKAGEPAYYRDLVLMGGLLMCIWLCMLYRGIRLGGNQIHNHLDSASAQVKNSSRSIS